MRPIRGVHNGLNVSGMEHRRHMEDNHAHHSAPMSFGCRGIGKDGREDVGSDSPNNLHQRRLEDYIDNAMTVQVTPSQPLPILPP